MISVGTYLLAPSWSRIYQKMPSVTNRWYIAHGNTRAMVDDDGALTDWYAYDAWGNLVASHSNTIPCLHPPSDKYCLGT